MKPYCGAQPTLLIGQDNCILIVTRELNEINGLYLSRSLLGWSAHGFLPRGSENSVNLCLNVTLNDTGKECENAEKRHELNEKLYELVKSYYQLDEFGIGERNKNCHKQEWAIKILEKTSRRIDKGWEVGLLWNKNPKQGIDSLITARRRLSSLEKN